MQLKMNKVKFNRKEVEQLLVREDKYITDLFSVVGLPERHSQDDEDEDVLKESKTIIKPKIALNSKTTRAKSLLELQERLQSLTSKKKLTYKEKLSKKNLKTRMKKKSKRDERNAQQKIERAAKLVQNDNESEKQVEVKPVKPIFNAEDKIVYSKFDFSNLGSKKVKKQEKDPKKLLENLNKQKEKIEQLKDSGEIDKAIELKEKSAWKNALAKAAGEKVKDDPILLKKSMKKQQQRQKSSKKKWDKRIAGVEKAKDERQKKRAENIAKKKKEKKVKKMKKASKKGKIIPGF